MKGTIRQLNSSGDTATAFDTETGVVREAEKILAQAGDTRSALFDATTREQIRGKSPEQILAEHEEVLIVPPMSGG